MDKEDKKELDTSLEPQLDLATNQITPDDDLFDVSTETFWEQAKKKDKFAPSILQLLKDRPQYHKGIPSAECKDRDGCL